MIAGMSEATLFQEIPHIEYARRDLISESPPSLQFANNYKELVIFYEGFDVCRADLPSSD